MEKRSNPTYEPISIRRESIVIKQTLPSGKYQICKSYLPENYQEHQDIFGEENAFRIGSYRLEKRKELFHREWAILNALSKTRPRMVPSPLDWDKRSLEILMSFEDYPTFQQKYREEPTEEEELTEKLVAVLARFHNHCNNHLSDIKRTAKNRLKLRKEAEEATRLKNYLQTIVYHCNPELDKYWAQKGVDPEKLVPREIRKGIKSFLNEQKISLDSLAERFTGRYQKINEGEQSFVAGDFGPQNVFYTEEGTKSSPENPKVIVFDFDKARLGSRDVDLIGAIYNIPRYDFNVKKEMRSLELAADYFKKTGFQEHLPERLAGFIASRLRENIRLFAVYCQMGEAEIERRFKHSKKAATESSNGDQKSFLEKMFKEHFSDFFDFYRYRGEGWELVIEPLPSERKGLIREQLTTIEDFLRDTNIIPEKIASPVRAKKFKEILTT